MSYKRKTNRHRVLEDLPPERNRFSNGLQALAGLHHDSPRVKTAAVDALREAGIGGSWFGDFVYAEPPFAEAWARTVARYKSTPKTGVRLARAISTSVGRMEVTT